MSIKNILLEYILPYRRYILYYCSYICLFLIFYFFHKNIQKLMENIIKREVTNYKNKIYYFLLLLLSFLLFTNILYLISDTISFFMKNCIKNSLSNIKYNAKIIAYIYNLSFLILSLLIIITCLHKLIEKDFINYLNIKKTINRSNFIYFILYLIPLLIVFTLLFIFKKYEMIQINKEEFNEIYSVFIDKELIQNKIILFIFIFYFAFCEELLFRYYLLFYIEKFYKKNNVKYEKIYIYIIIFFSLIFSMLHSAKNILGYIRILIFSLYLYSLKRKSESLIYCTLLHFINNFLAFFLYQ